MRWFRWTVEQFHGVWNLENAEWVALERDMSTGIFYRLTAPIRAGGKFSPPPTRNFVGEVNTLEPSTWGVTTAEAHDLWRKHMRSPEDDQPTVWDSAAMAQTLSPEASRAWLRDIVHLAKPRLVQHGLLRADTDTSSWPDKLWSEYVYDKKNKETDKLSLRHMRRIIAGDEILCFQARGSL